MWPVDRPARPTFYDQVYRWFPDRTFDSVLIVGAGSGTDVAVALAHGAKHVDAVEIDPTIQQIGVRRAPRPPVRRPARHPHRSTTAARSSARATTDYDLVVFALPDSLTLVSTTANIRLESFLFTNEAFASVRDHLRRRRRVRPVQLLPRAVAASRRSAGCSHDAFGGPPLVRTLRPIAPPRPWPPARRSMPSTAAPPPGDTVDATRLGGRPAAGDRRLAVPVPARARAAGALLRRARRSILAWGVC